MKRLIDANDLFKKCFPKADINAEPFDNKEKYPYWKTDITGFQSILKNASTVEIDELQKIKEITARALRSEDPINLYKARALEEIADILGIETIAPAPAADSKGQITIDDIIYGMV